jgi:hypothetical protein
MNRTPQSTEAGITLLLALLAMTIVGGMAYRALLYVEAYTQIVRTFASSLSSQQQLRKRLDIQTTSQRGCAVQQISLPGKPAQEWHVCSRGTQPFITNHPVALPPGRIDYNLLFAAPSRCPGQIHQVPNLLTQSPTSGSTCELPSQLTQSLVLSENIRCQNLTFEKQGSDKALIVATTGSLLCDGVLTLASSTLLIAGGDVKIASVASNSSLAISVTIISAHGDIVVGNVSGPVSLLTLGRNLLSAPPTLPSGAYPLPPFTQSVISGIKPSD